MCPQTPIQLTAWKSLDTTTEMVKADHKLVLPNFNLIRSGLVNAMLPCQSPELRSWPLNVTDATHLASVENKQHIDSPLGSPPAAVPEDFDKRTIPSLALSGCREQPLFLVTGVQKSCLTWKQALGMSPQQLCATQLRVNSVGASPPGMSNTWTVHPGLSCYTALWSNYAIMDGKCPIAKR